MSDTTPSPPKPQPAAKTARTAREAAKLRENLRKRKEQARVRGASAKEKP
jgi:hypothetical protein